MDKQIHQKNQKPASTRLGRKILLMILIVLGFSVAYIKINDPQTFPIKTVKIIDASTHVSHRVLRDAVLPYLSKGWLFVADDELAHALRKMPWVKTVCIKRLFPDQLMLQVIEQTPVAKFNDSMLFNAEGKIFNPPATDMTDKAIQTLPSLYAPEAMSDDIWRIYWMIKQRTDPVGLQIARLSVDANQSWCVDFTSPLHVVLGREQLMHRIENFLLAYPKVFKHSVSAIEYVDLRYDNGFAIKKINNAV